jgi:hypothetical protein
LPLLLIENTRYAREQVQHASASHELNRQALRSSALRTATPELERLIGIAHARD